MVERVRTLRRGLQDGLPTLGWWKLDYICGLGFARCGNRGCRTPGAPGVSRKRRIVPCGRCRSGKTLGVNNIRMLLSACRRMKEKPFTSLYPIVARISEVRELRAFRPDRSPGAP